MAQLILMPIVLDKQPRQNRLVPEKTKSSGTHGLWSRSQGGEKKPKIPPWLIFPTPYSVEHSVPQTGCPWSMHLVIFLVATVSYEEFFHSIQSESTTKLGRSKGVERHYFSGTGTKNRVWAKIYGHFLLESESE